MSKKSIISLLLVGFWVLAHSQQDTLRHSLGEVLVDETRSTTFDEDAVSVKINLNEYQYPGLDLGTVLANKNLGYIHNGQPGGLSTLSIRGTGSAHSLLVWNGMNLQSAMNGVTDLNLFSSFFIDEATLVNGGSATLFGSGNMGGRIEMSNEPFSNSKVIVLNTASSLMDFTNGIKLQSRIAKKLKSSTGILYTKAQNRYKPPGFVPVIEVSNAAYQQLGVMQSFFYKPSANWKMDLHVWWLQNQRELPNSLGNTQLIERQKDEALRSSMSVHRIHNKAITKLQAGFVAEHIWYWVRNSEEGNNLAYNTFTELEHIRYFNKKHHLGGHINQYQFFSKTLNYNDPITQSRISTNLFYRYVSTNQKFKINSSIKQEWVQEQMMPFIPALSFKYKTRYFSLFSNNSRTFRYPTFNDLYWQPGGNPNLLPEKGWSNDVGLKGKFFSKEKTEGNWQICTFSNWADNWIQWLPMGSFQSRPVNNLAVWARGVEAKLSIKKTWNTKQQLGLNLACTQQQTTHIRVYSGQDELLGKQLIFTPRFFASFQLEYKHKDWKLNFQNNYTGKRFTRASNTHFLPAFLISNLQISHPLKWRFAKTNINFGVQNLWNTPYQLMLGRPMPGRYFQLTLLSNFLLKNKNT